MRDKDTQAYLRQGEYPKKSTVHPQFADTPGLPYVPMNACYLDSQSLDLIKLCEGKRLLDSMRMATTLLYVCGVRHKSMIPSRHQFLRYTLTRILLLHK